MSTRAIALAGLLASNVLVCACQDPLEPEKCQDQAETFATILPPRTTKRLGEVAPDSGWRVIEDAGPDADAPSWVFAERGTKEEWLAMPCEEACRRTRAEGITGIPNAFTSCSFGTDGGDDVLSCNFDRRHCTDYVWK